METSPRQIRQYSTQITPTVASASDDRKHRVMTTAFKYNTLLFYLGEDESAQDSGEWIVHKWLRNRELIWWKIKRINAGVFWTAVHLWTLFSMHISGEMVKHVVFLTLLFHEEPMGSPWGGFISLILSALITHSWLCAKKHWMAMHLWVKTMGLKSCSIKHALESCRRYQIRHRGN